MSESKNKKTRAKPKRPIASKSGRSKPAVPPPAPPNQNARSGTRPRKGRSPRALVEQITDARRKAFIGEFLLDLNATKAAERAGFSSGKTASTLGSRLLGEVEVARAIVAKLEERAKKVDISVERVLRGLYEEATFFGPGASHGARVRAWENIGRYHQIFVDRIDATVTHTFTDMSDGELGAEFDRLRRTAPAKAIEGTAVSNGRKH